MEIITLFTALILFTNVTLLTILVPGGPIENRDFKQLKGFVFWGFNVFLITLGLLSYIISYYILTEVNWAYKVALILGILYLFIYLLDLGKIFPKSPTKMSKTLMTLEILNANFAVLIIILSIIQI